MNLRVRPKTEGVEDGSGQVMGLDTTFLGKATDLVRGAIDLAAANAGAGQGE